MVDNLHLRPPLAEELPDASALCLRSKAHWGYDQAFMLACREELTLTADELEDTAITLAIKDAAIAGVAQVSFEGRAANLDKAFVEPNLIGHGVGQALFHWACEQAKDAGAQSLTVTADPYAAAFYEKMGFELIGEEPSGSIPGRVLPVYKLTL